MNSKTLEITIKFAEMFNDVGRKRIYTKASLVIGKNQIISMQKTQKTLVEDHSNPHWWFKMKFNVDESRMHEAPCRIRFQVKGCKTLGDQELGFLEIPVRNLLDEGQRCVRDVALAMASKSGKPKGVLYFSYECGQNIRTLPLPLPLPSAPPCESSFPSSTY